ncbi:MAG: PEPxxWA-CTERM sorting domain-containing protein [Caulobacteraceae bacterium]
MKLGKFSTLASGAVAVLAMAALAASAQADTTLVAGTGWIDDSVSAANTPSDNSTVTFTVPSGQTDIFSLSDGFVTGDVYSVTVDGTTTYDSTFTVYPTNFPTGLGDTYYDGAWTNSDYSHLQVDFGAGTYDLVIEDTSDPGFGYPAGLGYRLDAVAVPEPAAWALMFAGLGMAGYGLRRRQRLAGAV